MDGNGRLGWWIGSWPMTNHGPEFMMAELMKTVEIKVVHFVDPPWEQSKSNQHQWSWHLSRTAPKTSRCQISSNCRWWYLCTHLQWLDSSQTGTSLNFSFLSLNLGLESWPRVSLCWYPKSEVLKRQILHETSMKPDDHMIKSFKKTEVDQFRINHVPSGN